jgi:hypothetical protein
LCCILLNQKVEKTGQKALSLLCFLIKLSL